METKYKIIDGYATIEIFGLKIRSGDGRIEIDVKERGSTVDRLYLEPYGSKDSEDGDYGINFRSHNDEIFIDLPYYFEEKKQ